LNRVSKWLEPRGDDPGDLGVVDAVVLVGDDVAEADDASPGDVRLPVQ